MSTDKMKHACFSSEFFFSLSNIFESHFGANSIVKSHLDFCRCSIIFFYSTTLFQFILLLHILLGGPVQEVGQLCNHRLRTPNEGINQLHKNNKNMSRV